MKQIIYHKEYRPEVEYHSYLGSHACSNAGPGGVVLSEELGEVGYTKNSLTGSYGSPAGYVAITVKFECHSACHDQHRICECVMVRMRFTE